MKKERIYISDPASEVDPVRGTLKNQVRIKDGELIIPRKMNLEKKAPKINHQKGKI